MGSPAPYNQDLYMLFDGAYTEHNLCLARCYMLAKYKSGVGTDGDLCNLVVSSSLTTEVFARALLRSAIYEFLLKRKITRNKQSSTQPRYILAVKNRRLCADSDIVTRAIGQLGRIKNNEPPAHILDKNPEIWLIGQLLYVLSCYTAEDALCAIADNSDNQYINNYSLFMDSDIVPGVYKDKVRANMRKIV